MQKIDLAILTWHQTYLSSYAGGYVRIRKFLQRFPKDINFVLLDNKNTIYSDILSKKKIIEYQSPSWINSMQKKLFILWFLLETISSSIIIYRFASKLIRENHVKVLYFPTGEFLQMYIVSLLLKKRFPHVKVVLDILNYGILDKNYTTYFQRLRRSNIGLIRASVITVTIYTSHLLMKKTINHADYIFTVSSDFVKKIKLDYKKETIDFTPSGVDLPVKKYVTKKQYEAIYIGRMTMEKGIFEVLAAWQYVIQKLPRAQLLLAGYADTVVKKAIETEIEEKQLSRNVTYIGDITEEKKWELLSKAELFVHLALREPLFPVITILEGFASGLPAVIYDMQVYRTANKEFAFSEDSIYITENGNRKKAAEKIITYLEYNKIKKKNISHSAFTNAHLFSWDRIAEKEFICLKNLINKSNQYDK